MYNSSTAGSTLSHNRTIPAVFPIRKSRRGSHSPVSIADKRALFDWAYFQRFTLAEIGRAAGVSATTISKWKKQVTNFKQSKIDERNLRLVDPTPRIQVVAAPTPKKVSEDPKQEVKDLRHMPVSGKKHSEWTDLKIIELLERQKNENLSNKEAAKVAGVHANLISKWRGKFGYAEMCNNKPSALTKDQRVVLLQRQQDEGLSNAEVAAIAQVHILTVTDWRKQLGFAGIQGRPCNHSDKDKAEILARIDSGELNCCEAARKYDISNHAIYKWRAERNRTYPVKVTRPDGTVIEVAATAGMLASLLN